MFKDPFGGSGFVIFLGVAVARVWGSDGIVELPNGTNCAKTILTIAIRQRHGFAPVTLQQTNDEMTLVKIVVPPLQGVGAGRQIERRANRADPTQSRRKTFAVLTAHFQDEVSAH